MPFGIDIPDCDNGRHAEPKRQLFGDKRKVLDGDLDPLFRLGSRMDEHSDHQATGHGQLADATTDSHAFHTTSL
jgi:hypothetical protein